MNRVKRVLETTVYDGGWCPFWFSKKEVSQMKRLGILCTVILVVLLLVALVVGCAEKEEVTTQEPTPSTPVKETQTYTNSEYGFSFGYPADWDIMEDFRGFVVFLAGPSVLDDVYMVNINLQTEQLSEEVTIKDYFQMVELNTKRMAKDYNKMGEYDTSISRQPTTVFTCTATVESDGKSVTLKDTGAVFIKDNIGYVITYDVPEELHDNYIDCFELVIDSFEFE